MFKEGAQLSSFSLHCMIFNPFLHGSCCTCQMFNMLDEVCLPLFLRQGHQQQLAVVDYTMVIAMEYDGLDGQVRGNRSGPQYQQSN